MDIARQDSDAQRTVWKMVEDIGTCMLTTRAGDHSRSRPMRGMPRAEENAIWFISDRTDVKDDEIARWPYVALAYADIKGNNFVSLSGRIEIVTDEDEIRRRWSEGASAYFPAGPRDPDVIMLRFTPTHGEYWDSPSNPLVLAIRFIEAQISGERVDLGKNDKVSMTTP